MAKELNSDRRLNDQQFEYANLKIGNQKVNRVGFRILKEKPEPVVLIDL